MIPIPPSCAIAIAIADSVTVSIAAEMSGVLRVMLRVRGALTHVSAGKTSLCHGMMLMSSKVRASVIGYPLLSFHGYKVLDLVLFAVAGETA